MAIEPLNITSATKTGFNNSPLKKSEEQPSIADLLAKAKEEEDKVKKSDSSEKEKDKVTLSEKAIQAFAEEEFKRSQAAELNAVSAEKFTSRLDRIKELSIDAIGLERISNDLQFNDRFAEIADKKGLISDELSSLGVSETDTRKIGNAVLAKASKEAVSINNAIENGVATVKDIKKLDDINKTINRANGAGLLEDSLNQSDKRRLDELAAQLDTSLATNNDRRLRQTEVDNLFSLQQQISEINGYRLNARDSVGTQGVLV